jgi:hypothetical protein
LAVEKWYSLLQGDRESKTHFYSNGIVSSA